LTLCEVNTKDIAHFRQNLNLSNIEILDLTCKVGRTRFDIAIVFNPKKLSVEHIKKLSKVRSDSTIKAAQIVEIKNLDDDKKISLYICHWASRLRGDGESRRKSAADMVYESATELMNNGQDVILMGDFNDNPYDDSVLNHLNSTRCHAAVIKNPNEFFYNPFWRTVVSENKYNHLSSLEDFRSGSYQYKQFCGALWHSYDQIMLSGSFLGKGYWHLNEEQTKNITTDNLLIDYKCSKHFIDHLPILCEITRL
jgi:hypothetical protein